MTVSDAATFTEPRRSISWSSALLVAGKGFQMGSGFLFWIIAARTTSVADMGTVAASVSAVILCTQIALLGIGASMIVAIGRGEHPGRVLDTGFTVVALTSTVVALGYLAVSSLIGGEVSLAQTSWPFATAFVAAAVAGTVLICLDQAGIALGRPSGTVVRYFLGGLATLLAVSALAWGWGGLDAVAVFGAWALGSGVVCVVGALQLRRWIGYRFRGRVHLGQLRTHVGVGLPNHLLTLTERLPALLVPLLVAHLVSPEATAYWYPAWMLAWVAYTIPIQVGLVQFSEGVRRPGALRETVRRGFLWGLLLGGATALALAVLAHPLLRLIGADYADASTTALRVLAVGIVPFAVWQAYNARCRATSQVGEGVLAGLVLAALICTTTALAAPHGSTALAVAWVGSSSLGAAWAGYRLVEKRGA